MATPPRVYSPTFQAVRRMPFGLPRDGGKGNLLLPEHPEHLVEPVNLVIPVGQAQVDALVFLQFHAGGIGDAQAEGGQLVFFCARMASAVSSSGPSIRLTFSMPI